MTIALREVGSDWEVSGSGLYVPPASRPRYARPVAIDLFCGAGGFSCGFHQAGWHEAERAAVKARAEAAKKAKRAAE